jgi:molecular chaperone DnaK (HSP70)
MKLKLDDRMKGSRPFLPLMRFLQSRMQGLDLSDPELDELADDSDGPPAYPGKDTLDIVVDYLTKVREAAFEHLANRYGADLFASIKRELVVTVPAVWSERAKDQTLKAVSRSNWGAAKISIITEPEAAAIYTLRGMVEGPNRNEVKVRRGLL